jgi:hypothetical protein
VVLSVPDIKGISLAHLHRRGMGYGSDACRKQLDAIAATGANWIAINDFAFMRSVTSPEVQFNRDRSMREDDIVKCIDDAHAAGLKVLVKPHIWSHEFWQNHKWHGDIKMSSEADWDAWFGQYGQYVLYHARIAERAKAEMFCIGVEYEGTSGSQEARWRKLIAEVRKVYSGPLTYASAFGEWPKIKWWDAVDYIGIDAYFPVAAKSNASEAEIRAGWDHVYGFLDPFAKQWKKPLLFTEIGYSPSAKAALEPWAYDVVDSDDALQARLYRIALEESAKHDYMAGVFLWKWFTSDEYRRTEGHDPFALQDRQQVIEVLKALWRTPVAATPASPSVAR